MIFKNKTHDNTIQTYTLCAELLVKREDPTKMRQMKHDCVSMKTSVTVANHSGTVHNR